MPAAAAEARGGAPVCALHAGDGANAELVDLSPDGRTLAVGTNLAVQDILGHRQVTGAYLVELAKRAEATLATFDKGLAPPTRTPY